MRVIAPKRLLCKQRLLCKECLLMCWLILTSFCVAGFVPIAAASDADTDTDVAEPRILVLGDSLSAAYNMPREAGWVNLLRERLQQVMPGTTVVNGSVSGATTAAGLQVLPRHLQEHNPTLVILELGANDGLQGKPIPYITRNLQRMIDLARKAGADVVLVGVRLPPNYGAGYTEPFFNQYAQLAENYQLAYVPFILDGVAGNDSLMQEDGLHPVAAAQPKVLANVWPAVARELGIAEQAKVDAPRP